MSEGEAGVHKFTVRKALSKCTHLVMLCTLLGGLCRQMAPDLAGRLEMNQSSWVAADMALMTAVLMSPKLISRLSDASLMS